MCLCQCVPHHKPTNFRACVFVPCVCVYISSTCDNILPFLSVEIFMRSPHLSVQFKQTGSGVLSPFFPDAVSLWGAFPYKTKHCERPSPFPPPANTRVYIKTWYPFSITHSCSPELFIFSEHGTVSRELWYVNSCDLSQVSHRPQRGRSLWWCLRRRRWKEIGLFDSGLCAGAYGTRFPPRLAGLCERRTVTLTLAFWCKYVTPHYWLC